MINVLLGPPGTGKTHKLIERAEDAIRSGTLPERVGYFAFTNRAADEALHRIEPGGFQLPYFRTLHSLAFNQLGLSRSRVFSRQALAEFANWLGLDLSTRNLHLDDELLSIGATEDDRTLFLMGVAAVSMVNKPTAMESLNWDRPYWEVKRIWDSYDAFKKARSLIDFNDMLNMFLNQGPYPDLDLIIIDEAQDLSRLQWSVVDRLIAHNPQAVVWFGGDDDQAIYQWAGAAVDRFLDTVEGETVILEQSYRVPAEVKIVANRVLMGVQQRAKKPWQPAEHWGQVQVTDDPRDFNHFARTDGGTTLYLARNFHFLRSVAEWLEEEGVLWGYLHQKAAPVQLSTIHGAKGAQADHVILDLSMTKRSFDELDTDAEKRVWYTAVTRAKHLLVIIEPYIRYHAGELVL